MTRSRVERKKEKELVDGGRHGRPSPGGETRWVGGIEKVSAALAASPEEARELWVEHKTQHPALGAIIKTAKERGIPVQFMSRPELDRALKGGKHQGIALRVSYDPTESFGEWMDTLDEARKPGLIIVALDQIQDPHNLGAIARSALQLGAQAVLTPERRSAPVTQAAVQSSAGAILKIKVHRVVNLAQALAKAKQNGFAIYGADASGKPAWTAALTTPCVLVIGSEGYGLRSLVRASCDELLSIPQVAHGVGSLNASCAATALLYEVARQKAAAS
jgi:23S rRNA (guanosine2251-2'-O)-methyltransferase